MPVPEAQAETAIKTPGHSHLRRSDLRADTMRPRTLRDRWPTLPLIVTSAHDESQRASAKGASVFLLKPIARDVLLRELRQFTAQTGLRRLLVVDDNEVSRYIVWELLNQPWLEVAEAANGTEAIRFQFSPRCIT